MKRLFNQILKKRIVSGYRSQKGFAEVMGTSESRVGRIISGLLRLTSNDEIRKWSKALGLDAVVLERLRYKRGTNYIGCDYKIDHSTMKVIFVFNFQYGIPGVIKEKQNYEGWGDRTIIDGKVEIKIAQFDSAEHVVNELENAIVEIREIMKFDALDEIRHFR